jgi:class 3 adenylate cyclase
MEKSLKALVLLDIVESTKFIESYGSTRAAKIFFHHDKLVRTLIYRFEGIEIDKTDGFLIIFDRCINGVNFALAYHRMIPSRTGLKARIGIHWGEVVLKKNDLIYVEQGAKRIEVEGIAKPVAARIMSLARGGQILLSDSARRSSEFRKNAFSPKETRYKCLGSYSLKGVKNPMLVYAVGVKDSDFMSPEENDKVKKVKRPPIRTKDWSLKDICKFLIKAFLLYVFFMGIFTFFKLAWIDGGYLVSELFGVDVTWVKDIKEYCVILEEKLLEFRKD